MNIAGVKNCYGCGVCATICTKRIIAIRLSNDGFYEPYITDVEKCTDCGLCIDVCSHSHTDLSLEYTCVKSYGAVRIYFPI